MGEKKKTEILLNREAEQRLRLFEESLKELMKLTQNSAVNKDSLSRNSAEYLYTTLTEDICRKCPKYRECFGTRKEKTLEEISSILKKAGKAMQVDGRMASGDFRKQCVYFQPFIEELSWLFRMLYQNRCWEKRLEGLRQVMYKQMVSQHTLMQECRRLLSGGTLIAGKKKRRLRRTLLSCGVWLVEGQEYLDGQGTLTLSLLVQPMTGEKRGADLARYISGVYQRRMQCGQMDAWLRPGKNRVSFVEEGGFQVLFGRRHRRKTGEVVCGDTFSFASYSKRRAVMVLSDGMGAGEGAHQASSKLIEAFEGMLEAGIDEEYALEVIHHTLLTRKTAEFSTLDVAVISLQTGMFKMLKAGGAATFIRHRQSVERIKPESLPPGCLTDQTFDLCCKKLYDGDIVIMISDGMLDFEHAPDTPYTMETILESIRTNNAQSFADKLMRMVPVPESGHDDDCTVLVAAVWEKRQRR